MTSTNFQTRSSMRTGHRAPCESVGASGENEPVTATVLSRRQLNRATLARQMLLERSGDDRARRDPASRSGCRLRNRPIRSSGCRPALARLQHRGARRRSSSIARSCGSSCNAARCTSSPRTTACCCGHWRSQSSPSSCTRHSDYRGRFDGVDLDDVMAYARDVLAESAANHRQLREAIGRAIPASTMRRRWHSPAATSCRSSRCRRGAYGRRPARSSGRRPRRGSADRSRRIRPSTTSCCGTSRRSGRRPCRTRPRGPGTPGCVRCSIASGPSCARSATRRAGSTSTSPTVRCPDEDTPAPVRFLPAVRQPPAVARRPQPIHRGGGLLRDLADHHRLPRQRPRRRDGRRNVALRPADQDRAESHVPGRPDDHHASAAPAGRGRRGSRGTPVY